MKAENRSERKKRLYSFAALYLGALCLIALAFAFTGGQRDADVTGESVMGKEAAPGISPWILRVNGMLLRNMQVLQQLDDKYARLLADTAWGTQLADAERSIGAAEMAFSNSIDSLEMQGTEYSLISTAYRSVLNDRRALSNFRAALATGSHGPVAGQQDLKLLQQQLVQKDRELALLDGHATADARAVDRSGSALAQTEALKNDNRTLQAELDEQKKNNEGLRNMVLYLRKATETGKTGAGPGGEKLSGRNFQGEKGSGGGGNETDGLTTENPAPGGNAGKYRDLERRSAELAAEGRFAQVDCNLTRADARQTIYNSRQRKELLADALATLTTLSKSDNLAIQQKAREKLALLRTIAAAIHD